ncbi:glycosyltransferase family 61 protein [Pseudomonas sp. GX19020]|uniref:glycosyltransferase family 61 protein n=1 Tax=Pseudomonas sp. GX19020 TaxID=2942277 RepID=UPI002018424E|nr:glycosyltransferase family 61 protein [Pseudomonas sp. GX19020]MCL4068765.1 glycosyltransferase family 61 protein [Pseudomonas sp. GX19020]
MDLTDKGDPDKLDESGPAGAVVKRKPAKKRARAAFLPRPDPAPSIAAAMAGGSFFLQGGRVDAWYNEAAPGGHSDVLMVTFDNVTSIHAHEPHQPWLLGRALKINVPILGLLAGERDWYRNADAQKLLTQLHEAGFFRRFRRVVFIGTSMGAFAALALSALVPGVEVVAFSPQSTLAPDLAPFEDRYPGPTRHCDWQDLPLRDAADSLAPAARIWLIYDPFNRTDRLHANRLKGDNIERVHFNFAGHRMLREFRQSEMLNDLIAGLVLGEMDRTAVNRHMRQRREIDAWQNALLRKGEALGHAALTARAARRLFAIHPERRDLRKLAWKLERIARGEPAESREERRARREKKTAARRLRAWKNGSDTSLNVSHPDLRPPFTGEIRMLSNALILPEREHDTPLASGVLHADGSWCDLSEAWIRARKSTPAPVLSDQDEIRDLPGTHLYGGHFRGHFGHFLVESTARLWALDHLGETPESILYLPYRGDVEAIEKVIRGHAPFFRLLGIDLPVRTFGEVLRVERLIVPELGFGWLERYAGSPAYRDFMQSRLSAAAVAEGGEKLYVSRAQLRANKGGILGETVIEENLARAGFEIFHPERHPLEVQIARYKAAKTIVALDGSALHLAAYVMQKGGRVGMILRRSSALILNAPDYDLQFRNFAGLTPDVINVIVNDWVAGDAKRADFRSVGEVDFVALFDRLRDLGYLPVDFRPELPTQDEVRAMLAPFQDHRGDSLRPLMRGEKHGDEED